MQPEASTLLDRTSISFERATVEDAEALLDLEQRVAVPRIYDPRVKVEDAIKEIQSNAFYFIKHRIRIIGSASFRRQYDGSAYIGNMAVDPIYRRQGIARATMDFLLGQIGDAARVELVTHPANDRALRLYKSFGFTVEAEIGNYFGDGEPRVKLVRFPAGGRGAPGGPSAS
jgi:ribosomal protein S18 acetylase RimI-like enzyme